MGAISVGILNLFLIIVYLVYIIRFSFNKGMSSGKLSRILVASGFVVLILGSFISGFIDKPDTVRTFVNIFNFLSAGCLAAAFFLEALKGD